MPESLSASARIRWWYLVTVAGSAATPSSRASAIACSPARGVRRSWLIPATSWQWLISRACLRSRAWTSRWCAQSSSPATAAISAVAGRAPGRYPAPPAPASSPHIRAIWVS
jgi:hypothetical protein